MGNFCLRKASTCSVLLTLMGALWNLPFSIRGETCDSNITIRPVVDISSSPENSTLAIGVSITLNCTAQPRAIDIGYKDRWVKYIEWYDLQGNEVGSKCQQPSNKRKLSCPLVLKNLTVDKFGRYTCQAGNGYSSHCTRKSFEIQVHAPELIGVPRNQSADIGANVTFNCTATGLTTPSISWIKNNDSFALQSNPRVTFINDPLDDKSTQSHLFITRVKEEDFGKYQCEAKNSGDKNLSLPAFLTPKVSATTHTFVFVKEGAPENSASQITVVAVSCTLVAAVICVVTGFVWNRRKNCDREVNDTLHDIRTQGNDLL